MQIGRFVGKYFVVPHAFVCVAVGIVREMVFDKVRVKEIPEAEISAIDPDLLSFMNLNTPEDLERANAVIKRREK